MHVPSDFIYMAGEIRPRYVFDIPPECWAAALPTSTDGPTCPEARLRTNLSHYVSSWHEIRPPVPRRLRSPYHFMIVTDLACFCTLTHLLSLVVTRSVHDSVKRTYPQRYHHQDIELAARLAHASRFLFYFMAAMFVLLDYAFWVTGCKDIYAEGQYRCPMKCSIDKSKGGQPWRLMVMNMTLMSYCYAVQIFLSCRTGRLFWMHHIKDHLVDKKGQPINSFSRGGPRTSYEGLKISLPTVGYFLASEVETILGPTVYFGLCRYSYSSCDSWDSLNLMRGIQKHLIRESDAKELDSCPSEGPLDDGACK
ncbi:hypothetical protein CI238_06537 [Colletotrichum incanum]|uniref:Uncharacterized protein n=1 Tax=Colletotrichum incanum TaxID=1573173 RepID=A0A161W8D8_COLIC|nr:hypothetical protein CI238_06537 [Colletotrichum incanum]